MGLARPPNEKGRYGSGLSRVEFDKRARGSPALAAAWAVVAVAVAARRTALEALLGLALGARDLLPRGLIDYLHGKAHLAAVVEAEQLDEHLLALLDDVLDALRPAGGQLR